MQNFLVRQLGQPSGLFGRWLLRLLNRLNAGINQQTLEHLALRPGDHLLEVGFGGGDLLSQAMALNLPLQLAGVELSDAALAAGKRRFRTEIAAGVLALKQTDGLKFPFPDQRFSAVCTVNTIYFWSQPEVTAAELRRVLAPGGRCVIGYSASSPADGQNPLARNYTPEEVSQLLAGVGFEQIETRAYADKQNGRYYITRAVRT